MQNNNFKDAVGFSSLPEQVHRKSIKKGFEFSILIVGDSGLGKSTLINSLFMTDLYSDRTIDSVNGKTDSIKN
jgi:septin family protein